MLTAMIRLLPKTLVVLVVFALVAVGCSSNDTQDTTTTSTTTTTTEAPTTTSATTTSGQDTTTSTIPPIEVSDAINGLPADDDAIDRRVVAIKIDNHRDARPQSGLETADAVYEMLVEGGITRFIALFHQSDLDYVGPNRSGRPSDAKLIAALHGAPFQVSGAQGWVQSIFSSKDINIVYDNGTTTYRISSRRAPHNLYTSSLLIREWADDHDWSDENPGNLFTFGEPTEGVEDATVITTPFSGSPPPHWEWNGETYLRFQSDEPHMWIDEEGNGDQVSFDTLVVLMVDEYIERNPAGTGTSLPTANSVGTGEALVFVDGKVIHGTWERESEQDRFTLVGEDGQEIVLAPSRMWISLIPDDETVTWE